MKSLINHLTVSLKMLYFFNCDYASKVRLIINNYLNISQKFRSKSLLLGNNNLILISIHLIVKNDLFESFSINESNFS